MAAKIDDKIVWLKTNRKEVLTAAMEASLSPLTVLFDEGDPKAEAWRSLGRFRTVTARAGGELVDPADGRQLGLLQTLSGPDDLRAAERAAGSHQGTYVMDATDWQASVIPAENLVAAFQASPTGLSGLLAVAPNAAAARVFLEALEVGTGGVVLRTDDPVEVRALAQYLSARAAQAAGSFSYDTARVTSVRSAGMGDRACVDLASLCAPGEGLLAGNFARSLFLVHSECAESSYIASRPFRVNAGPVHAYVQRPDGKTAYLSELRSGSEVVVADPQGRQRTALVGRVKIEARPLVLVTAVTADGEESSVLLQNAETVRLVGPAPACSSSSDDPTADAYVWQEGGWQRSGGGGSSCGGGRQAWRAISVSDLQPGDELLLLRQSAARHTGIAIDEAITER